MNTREKVKKEEDANENNLGFIKFLLYAHNVIRMSWVLVLLEVSVDLWERDCGWVGKRRLWNFRREIIEELGEKGESWSDRVFLVRDDHACRGGMCKNSVVHGATVCEG